MSYLLETTFVGTGEVKGFTFVLLNKSDKAYLYEVRPIEDEPHIRHFEVFLRRKSKASTAVIDGVTINYEEKEIYPNANAFGKWAFTFRTLKEAIPKFLQLSYA